MTVKSMGQILLTLSFLSSHARVILIFMVVICCFNTRASWFGVLGLSQHTSLLSMLLSTCNQRKKWVACNQQVRCSRMRYTSGTKAIVYMTSIIYKKCNCTVFHQKYYEFLLQWIFCFIIQMPKWLFDLLQWSIRHTTLKHK